jgi:hypothetical protein
MLEALSPLSYMDRLWDTFWGVAETGDLSSDRLLTLCAPIHHSTSLEQGSTNNIYKSDHMAMWLTAAYDADRVVWYLTASCSV